ncbi:MAG: branched-chain amino acid ABC transporter permease [Candidatus Bipolaricaulota bacterium]|nr:branched-chain amino acid ABC transporter permease [Candidatus Bipolaricaulota bacterium]MCX7844798.1 branched-chain amino acid ABC transporter permease [Candidatus Bipolaricaulota bacterium]MDW8152342.1 branched-chain amino acid ABC transporter permease [Candidatus Bipolaricaulota bacterium]
MSIFLQQLLNGFTLGSLYALIAIGYTLVYGILRFINFAHGDIFMFAGYWLFYWFFIFQLPWWLAALLAVALTAGMGVVIERVAYRPLRHAPRISLFITAMGVSFLLGNTIIVLPWAGGRQKPFPTPAFMTQVYTVGTVRIQGVTLWVPLIAAACLLALLFLVYRTKVGRAMRAIATDIETTALMGADINRVISYTFLVGSALAAVGGILWGCRYPRLQWDMGVLPGLRSFTAAVVGGIGNIVGAMLGGYLLGLAEILFVAFLPHLSGLRDAFVFGVLILFLLFKPTGILGKPLKEKV